jgi:hypothetical protein
MSAETVTGRGASLPFVTQRENPAWRHRARVLSAPVD